MAAILPGAILVYHALGFWFWTAAQNRDGRRIMAEPLRRVWAAVNSGSMRTHIMPRIDPFSIAVQ